MMFYFIAFLLSFSLMLLIIPRLIKLAYKIDYVEKPKLNIERKIHTEPKPYLASVGIFFTFWSLYSILVRNYSTKIICIFIASSLIFLIGMVDDYYKIKGNELGALPKFIIQFSSCMLVYFAGVKFIGITNPANSKYIILPFILQFILTLLWLFGVTTVINFTDGLDGLAGGISCISACTLFVVALSKNNYISAMMSILLVGTCLGYLHFNKFPAKILMGDAGATFLGFMLGIISLDGAFKQATVISILIPIMALGLPIFDNIIVVIKRIKNKKPVYVGDSSQLHFRLLTKGFTHKQTVYLLYSIAFIMNIFAVGLLFISK